MIITKTPLRVSFFGGGSDLPEFFNVHGKGATLSVTVDKYVYLAVNKCVAPHIRLIYSQLEQTTNVEELKHDRAKEALKAWGINSHIEIASFSDVPTKGTGLGSSSTFTVGLVHALEMYGQKYMHFVQPHRLAEFAFAVERQAGHILGLQDAYAAAYGKANFIVYEKGDFPDVEALSIDNMFELFENLLFFDTKIERDTTEILKDQVSEMNVNSTRALVNLAYVAKRHFVDKKYDDFGSLLNAAWEHKKRLSSKISNQLIDECYAKCLSLNAIGGKLLGAGGGGTLLIYAKPCDHIRITEEMKKAGLERRVYKPEVSGSTVQII